MRLPCRGVVAAAMNTGSARKSRSAPARARCSVSRPPACLCVTAPAEQAPSTGPVSNGNVAGPVNTPVCTSTVTSSKPVSRRRLRYRRAERGPAIRPARR